MRHTHVVALLLACALAPAALATPAAAQSGPDQPASGAAGPNATGPATPGGRHGRHADQEPAKPNQAAPSGMKIPPEIWPRLDRGAIVCDSLDSLKARADLLADGQRQPLPPGCRPVTDTLKVTILDRVPPGATQVRIDATRETGWTDAWLPEKAPFTPGQSRGVASPPRTD